MSGCCHGWDAQRGEGCPEGPGCNEPVPYPMYAFCAEQLPDDWREMSSGSVALAILTAAADPAAPGRVWSVQANEGSDDCPLCFHAPDRHDGESCGVEVGYDHLNGSHECGCPLTPPARVPS